jgi:hypothetical protein
MSLLENIKNTLQQGWNVAKEKGELGARIGRLRLELIRLEREREQQFARLGRAYHANATDLAGLEPLKLEIDRLTQTMRDRESVMAQLLEQDNTPKDTGNEEPLNFAAEETPKSPSADQSVQAN